MVQIKDTSIRSVVCMVLSAEPVSGCQADAPRNSVLDDAYQRSGCYLSPQSDFLN
jgi:hypothetical protein